MSRTRSRSLRRTVRRFVALLALLLVLEYLVFPQLAGARRSLSTLANVNVALLAAALLAEVGAVLSYAQLTRSVLPRESAPSLLRTTQIQLATLAVSHLVPGGAAAGSALGIKFFLDEGVSPEDAGFAITAQSLGSALVLNVILWLALIASIPLHGFNPVYVTAAAAGVVVLGAFFALVLGLTRGEARAARILRGIARHTPFFDEESAQRAVHRVAERLWTMLADRQALLRTVGWAAANWLFDAACLWIFLAAFGDPVDTDSLLVAYGLAYVLAAIPITPGGLGVVEAVLSASLIGFGVARPVALVGVVAYRLVNFWLPIPIGGLAYASLRAGIGRRPTRRERVRQLAYEAASEREDAKTWAERHGVDLHRHH
ncbi:MAG TPA: lysylphosphatidylglycerol synthase transmembrane domain-containing protein [Actinomycetota bacterium]